MAKGKYEKFHWNKCIGHLDPAASNALAKQQSRDKEILAKMNSDTSSYKLESELEEGE